MSDLDSVVDPEFSPVLALVHQRGAEALEQFRRGTHGEVAPEVVSHCKALIQEARRSVDRLKANKRDLEQQEKRAGAELTEQRQVVLAEMDRELADARARMKALKEQREGTGGSGGFPSSASAGGGASAASTPGNSPVRGAAAPGGKRIGSYFTGQALAKDSGSSGMPGDVDYWRAQAQDLALVVEGRREALKSVEARIRSISHLNEHQARAQGVIGLLRQAESQEKQKAADYLRKAHALKEKAGMISKNSKDSTSGAPNNNNSGRTAAVASQEGATAAAEETSTEAALADAEATALDAIVNVLEPRVEVSKDAARMWAARCDQLKERLSRIEGRRSKLGNVSHNVQTAVKYCSDMKQELQEEQAKIAPPNTAIVGILRKQHADALGRLSRSADSLLSLRLEVADLETQLRENRVNAIRYMHSTGEGTRERLAQLRALRGAEVVESQINAIDNECAQLKSSLSTIAPRK